MRSIFSIGPFLLAILARSVAAQSAVPAYSIDSYCEKISQVGGGSYSIKAECIKQENEAVTRLRGMGAVELRITAYCQRIGEVAGGSYSIYEECIKQEIEAKNHLGQ
jgi:hypothetical protein